MAGEFRREQVQDPLGNTSDLRQGTGLNTPVSVGGVSRPSSMNVAPVNTDTMNKLAAWGGEAIRKEASKQWNKDLLEGQMAYQQGRAFDEVTSDGNKWKAEGYHVMEAQTLSSTFLAAQQNEISSEGYALSPEEYRNQYIGRLDALIDGKDPRVQELVRKTMVGQMPTLVGQHTTANLAYSQQRTAEALVTSIDVVSKDPTASDALLSIASDSPDGPGAGLGPEERRAAVAKGVAAAFENDNPAAYIKLKAAGLLDNLTPEQKAGIDNARQGYMQKQRQTWNADKAEAFDGFWTKVENGEFKQPIDAAKAFAEVNGKFGIEMSAEEGYSAMTAAKQGNENAGAVTMTHIETAITAGDYGAAAMMAAPALVDMESGGRYDATGPSVNGGDRAIGKYQVMASNVPNWTLKHYGIKLTPEQFRTNKAAQDAVFQGEFGGYIRRFGNVRDAVSMWHSGRPYEEAVRDGAADVNMSTQNYVDKIMSNMTGRSYAQTRQDNATGALNDSRVQYAQVAYEEMAPRRTALDEALVNGSMSKEEWRRQRGALYTEFNVRRTEADVNQELATTAAAANAAAVVVKQTTDAAEKAAKQDAIDRAGLQIAAAETTMRSVWDDPNATLIQKQQAVAKFSAERAAAYATYQIPMSLAERTGNNKETLDMVNTAIIAEQRATEQLASVNRAANDGSLGTDPTIDAKTRTKWWDGQVDAVRKSAQQAKANNPKMTNDEVTAMVQQGMLDTMSKSGYIPEDFKARYSSTLNGPLIDKNGVPTQEAVSTISDYMAMKVINPRVANMMLDESSRAVADAIANDAGNNVTGVSFAVQQRERDGQIIPGAKDPFVFSKDPAVMDAVNTATASYFGDDKWFNFFGWRNPDAFRDITADPSQRQAFKTEIDRVVLEKYALGGGKGRPESVVKAAIADVGVRTAIIGGTPMVAPKGVDMVAETFGSGLANFGGSPGRKADMMSDPSSVDNAVRNWIIENAGKPNSGIPVEIAKAWNEVNIPAEGILDIPGAMLYAARQSMSFTVSDEERRAGIDVSPMTVNQRNGGTFLMVSIQPADGSSPVIANIPLAQAGSAWITKLQQQQP